MLDDQEDHMKGKKSKEEVNDLCKKLTKISGGGFE
jgi:hypothetical protein